MSPRRNAKAAKRFLKKLIKNNPSYDIKIINTDKNPAYGQAIKELKKERHLSHEIEHKQIKYQNNRFESEHGKIKRLIHPALGFHSMKTAYAIIKVLWSCVFLKKANSIFGCMVIATK